MPRMPDEELQKEWPSIKDQTTKLQRSKGIRAFEIKDARNTWEVTGRIANSGSIFFFIKDFPNYEFHSMSNGDLSCNKIKVERISDSGKLSCHEGRFNLVNTEDERKTIRTHNLKFYIREAFETKEVK